MADLVPVLIGTAGMVIGECYVLHDGSDVVIGRSRSCDISLRRTATYLKAPPEVRDLDHDFNTVSRRHLRLQIHESVVRLQDMSTNGSFCNDEALQQSKEMNLSTGSFTLRLGTREAFQVALLPKDDPRVVAQQDANHLDGAVAAPPAAPTTPAAPTAPPSSPA